MKAIQSKNNKFIQLSERPIEAVYGGLKVTYIPKIIREDFLPIATTHVIAGKTRYYLKELGYPIVTRVEIKNYKIWELIYEK